VNSTSVTSIPLCSGHTVKVWSKGKQGKKLEVRLDDKDILGIVVCNSENHSRMLETLFKLDKVTQVEITDRSNSGVLFTR